MQSMGGADYCLGRYRKRIEHKGDIFHQTTYNIIFPHEEITTLSTCSSLFLSGVCRRGDVAPQTHEGAAPRRFSQKGRVANQS